MNKKGQEEMVGFGLILILVAIILIVVVTIYIRSPSEPVLDNEANSFIQSTLQYTTTCEEENGINLSVQELLAKCEKKEKCYYKNMDPCLILNTTIKAIIRESWNVNDESPVKGYKFIVNISEDENTEKQIFNIKEGVVTNNYIGGEQQLPPKRGSWEEALILFFVYS